MATLITLLVVLALIAFIAATFNAKFGSANLIGLGLGLLTLAFLLGRF